MIVWLKINKGILPKVVGVLCHVGNRTSDFHWLRHHCETTSAPSFPGLDVCHLGFPSFSFSSGRAKTSSARPTCAIPSAPAFRSLRTTRPQPVPPPPQPHPSSPCPPHGAKVARSSSRSSDDSLCNLRPFKLRFTAWHVKLPPTSFSPSAPFSHPVLPHRLGPTPSRCNAGHLPAPPSPIRFFSRRGCTSPVPSLCSTVCCDSHCHSHRCPQHRPSVPQPPVGSSRPARPPRTCRASGCSSTCSVGFSAPLTAPVGGVGALALRCNLAADVLTVWNQLHLTVLWVSATCTARAPVAWCMILTPCREMARGRLADEDGAVTPTPLVQSLGFGRAALTNCKFSVFLL